MANSKIVYAHERTQQRTGQNIKKASQRATTSSHYEQTTLELLFCGEVYNQ